MILIFLRRNGILWNTVYEKGVQRNKNETSALWNIYQSLLNSIWAPRSEILNSLHMLWCLKLGNQRMLTKICTPWDIWLLSALWWRNYVMVTLFPNDLNHIVSIPVLPIISHMPMSWSGSVANFSFSASLYVFGNTSPRCDFGLPKAK